MSTPRQQLAEQIAQDNASFDVRPYPFTPKNVNEGKPVVSVWRDAVNPSGESRTVLAHELTAQAYGSRTAGERAEDELDDILDAVALSVERLNGFKLTSATRATFNNDTISGWLLKLDCTSANVYRQHIQEERAE